MRFFARSLTCTAAIALVCAMPAPVVAQSASDIVERMLAEYERRSEGVGNYTLIQEVMGFETVSYFEKEIIDGRPVFRLKGTSAGGMTVGDSRDGSLDQVFTMGDELARKARYEGRDRIDGYDVYVLVIPDFEGMDFGRNMTPDADFEPKRGRIFLDVDTYAPRRMEFEGEMTNEQGVHEVTTSVEMGDFREVGGMLMPYRTVISIEGLGAAIDPETRAQFEQMQAELENMPPEQRRMVESMMAQQLDQFRAMMGGSDAPMTVEMTVREVLVNAGPPAGR